MCVNMKKFMVRSYVDTSYIWLRFYSNQVAEATNVCSMSAVIGLAKITLHMGGP